MSDNDLIRRIDAIVACQVGPSDEWSLATKDGYNQAATDVSMNVLRIAPAVLAELPEVKALIAAALQRAGLAVAETEIGYHDGVSGDWHPYSPPAILSAACGAVRALIPTDHAAALEAVKAQATVSREYMAFVLWKAEADRAAPNVGRNRTPEQFAAELDGTRARWLSLADAAIRAGKVQP